MLSAEEPMLASSSGDVSAFHQLRTDREPPLPWALSLRQMCEPAATLTRVLVSSFNCCQDDLDRFKVGAPTGVGRP